MKHSINAVLLALLLLLPVETNAQQQDRPDTNQIPRKVMDGLKAKFPKPEIDKWTKEKEGAIVVYDFEFKQGGQKLEADVREDGTIHNWERAITAKELPAVVRKAIERKYPKATMKEAMEITAVNDGKDQLEGYEVVLHFRGKKDVEVTAAPDGKILEDSGEKR